jgi:hypothetical protein
VLGKDVRVVSGLEGEDRRLELGGPLRRPRSAVPLDGRPVEADRPGETVPTRRCEPGVPAAEAEADGEDDLAAAARGGAEVLDGSADVPLDPLRRRLRDVIRVREVVVALRDAGRAPEVVERERSEAALGEPERELLVEAVEPPDVRQDDDAHARAVVGEREERGELRPVGRREDDVLGANRGAAGDRGDRRDGVELEAHPSRPYSADCLGAARRPSRRATLR